MYKHIIQRKNNSVLECEIKIPLLFLFKFDQVGVLNNLNGETEWEKGRRSKSETNKGSTGRMGPRST